MAPHPQDRIFGVAHEKNSGALNATTQINRGFGLTRVDCAIALSA